MKVEDFKVGERVHDNDPLVIENGTVENVDTEARSVRVAFDGSTSHTFFEGWSLKWLTKGEYNKEEV